jgi:hypothetical protein
MKKITDEDIQYFDENGYVILRGIIQPDELGEIKRESLRLIDEVLAGGPADSWCSRGPEGVPYYLRYLHSHPNTFSLRLLAHPFIADLLHRMVGPDFIPCFESLVFKLPGNGSSVPWHRDDQRFVKTLRIFNVDIYPDVSTVGNGCVWVVPGSHMWSIEEAAAMIERGRKNFDLPNAVPAEMEPGDVLLHHTKVLHGSQNNTSSQLRRVIYFDQRTIAWNEKYRWWHPEFITQRCKLLQRAFHERRKAPYPSDEEQLGYQVPPGMPVWDELDDFDPRIEHGKYSYRGK